jgi:hypothetical protein
MFMNFLINPLKSVLLPLVKPLVALVAGLSAFSLGLIAIAGLVAYFIKQRSDIVEQIKANNIASRGMEAETIRNAQIRRSREARGATISTEEGLSDAERLKTISVEGAGGRSVNFGRMFAERDREIASFRESGVSELAANQFKNEMAQRDVIYLRNAIAAQQNQLVTDNRPITREENQQLALLTDMVKYLERQVNITQSQSDDAKKRQDDEDQYQQLIRVKSMGAGAH